MAFWVPDISGRGGHRARAIAEAIAADIAAGRLKPGDRLPPQRELAHALSISPDTVMRAYAEATRRGHVAGEVGRGTFICPPAARPEPAMMTRPDEGGPIDFSRNLPFIGDADDALARTLAALARQGDLAVMLDHQRPGDGVSHRQAAAAWFAGLGIDASVERIALSNGAQQGVFATLMTVLRPGDVLLTDMLTYAPVRTMAQHLGLRIIGLPMDVGGTCPDGLEAACRRWAPRAFYCMPTLHTPTAVTMNEDRRRRLAAVAAAHDLLLIEDDVFGSLPADRPPPIAAFAPQGTVLVTSTSKSLAPGLRVGFVHAPQRLVAAIGAAISLASWMPPPLMAEIAARWIGDGTAARLNAAQRAHAARRQAAARAILPQDACADSADGLHLWLRLPKPWSGDAFAVAAKQAGVLLQPASAFAIDGMRPPEAVRLCLSHEGSDQRVEQGLARLAALLDHGPAAVELVL